LSITTSSSSSSSSWMWDLTRSFCKHMDCCNCHVFSLLLSDFLEASSSCRPSFLSLSYLRLKKQSRVFSFFCLSSYNQEATACLDSFLWVLTLRSNCVSSVFSLSSYNWEAAAAGRLSFVLQVLTIEKQLQQVFHSFLQVCLTFMCLHEMRKEWRHTVASYKYEARADSVLLWDFCVPEKCTCGYYWWLWGCARKWWGGFEEGSC
jgi:hypothetical protein